jgi:hypothetical protein
LSPADLAQTKFGGFFAGTDPLAFFPAVISPFDPVDHTTPPLQTASTVAAGFASNRVPFMAADFDSPFQTVSALIAGFASEKVPSTAAFFGFYFHLRPRTFNDHSRTFNHHCHL